MNVFESLVSDPLNTLIALLIFGAIVLFLKYALPALRRQLVSFMSDRNFAVLFELVINAVRAAEQARRKGELDRLLTSIGLDLPVELSDDERCREYAIAYVQSQLNKFSWGHLVDVATIYNLVLSALRVDAHKGPPSLDEELAMISPEQLARGLPPGLLSEANAIANPTTIARARRS